MKLANCNEHPDLNKPSLACWALRHDDGRRVTPEKMMEIVRERDRLRDMLSTALIEMREGE